MAEDKRIRVTADVTPLRQLREEALSLYREIDQAAVANSRNTEKNLQQLREQLSLMEDRNQLEKLLIDLKRQSSLIQVPQIQQEQVPTTQVSQSPITLPIQEKPRETQLSDTVPSQEVQRENRPSIIPSPQEKPREVQTPSMREGRVQREEPIVNEEENSITWDLNEPEPIVNRTPRRKKSIVEASEQPEEIEEQEEEEKPTPRRKKRRKQQTIQQEDVEPIIDEETGSVSWDLRRPVKPSTERVVERTTETIRESQKEILTEINRHVENIDNSVTNTDNSTVNTDNSRNIEDNSENSIDNSQNIENNRENTINNSRSIENNNERVINNSRSIENNRENLTENVRNIENNRENVTNNSRNTVNNNENLTENVKNIDRNVESVRENTSVLREKDPVEVKPEYQAPTEQPRLRERDIEPTERREVRIAEGQQQFNFDDENIIKAIEGVSGAIYQTSRELGDVVKNLIKGNNEKRDSSGTNRYLETLAASLSRIEDNTDEIKEYASAINNQGRIRNSNERDSSPITPPRTEDSSGGLNIGGMGKGLLGRLGALGAVTYILNQLKNVGTERYFRNQEFEMRSEYQGTVETAANYKRVQAANEADMYRWIPIFGNIIARSIEMPANIAADRIMQTFAKYAEAETKTSSYAQTFGTSAAEAMKVAGQEGRYAADALGMDVGSYLQRRTELTRAAGGRAPGGSEFDVNATRETQSLMAAERLYGISPSAINRLQGAMRFGDQYQNLGGSVVIRAFERSMKELNISFSEIASTIEESLETFSRRSDEILSKAGEFDAGKVTALLTGIRTATGAQGRQLERYQSAFSGSGISQDETTQALLLRTLTRTNPNIETYSQAMAELEKVQSGNADPEFMRNFLSELQGLSQNNEQFMTILKGVFPNLSWQDIRTQFAEGDSSEIINRIYDEIRKSFKRLREEEPRGAYDPSEARRTVGQGARIQAGDTNRQIAEGGKSLADVCKILEEIRDKIPISEQLKEVGERIIANSTTGAGPGSSGVATPGTAIGIEIGNVLLPLWEKLFNKLGLVSSTSNKSSIPQERE